LGVVWRDNQWQETLLDFPFQTDGTRLNELPTVFLEDITSGRLAEAERLAAQPFPDTAKPFERYVFQENFRIFYPVLSRSQVNSYVQYPETKPIRVAFFYKTEINDVKLVMATVQVLNRDKTETFVHMVNSEDFVLSRWDFWIPFISLKYEPIYDLALDDSCNSPSVPFRNNNAAKNVVCPINTPQKQHLENLIQQTVDQGVITEEWEEIIFYLMATGVWG